jgi:alpha-galactosidase
MCLVSRYKDAFADELIRLVREVGVTYFKWDAIGQYGCNDAGHQHGAARNSEQERADCYAFEQVRAMSAVVDKLCAACPEAIVDFDVTEGGRTVGLGFLSSGKYFLINNGPYSHNYDMAVPADGNVNLFFFPGPARAWVCRTPLTYDKWIPSVLFLTHYLPDDPASNQDIALASLVLGQNGIWGDLLSISEEGVARFGETLARYKEVRDDITQAAPVFEGTVGGSPEVHEKIAQTGRGVVCVFASARGRYTYVTQNTVAEGVWHNEGVTLRKDSAGRAVLTCEFTEAGAKLAFFGVGK